MRALIKLLQKSGLLGDDWDYHLIRASMVLIFLMFGYQKWFAYEAQALIPFISNGPLLSWMYPVLGIRGATYFLGVSEWLIALLLFIGFWNKNAGILGALGGIVSFVCTVTVIPFMPDGWAASAGGFPAMTETVAFLMKDVVLLAVSFYLLKQDAVRALAAAPEAREQEGAVEEKRAPRPARSSSVEGQLALVTGGARGIGRAIAAELLRSGARVVIGDLEQPEMEQTCRELASEGPIDWVRLDVSDHDSRQTAIAAVREKLGPIAILVNNAGIAAPGFFADEDPQRIAKALAVDLAGAICLTRMVLPHMIEVGWGRVANVSSMMAFTGSPGFAVYSAAKAGMLSFNDAVDRELASMHQIHFTAVLPPSVRTRAFEDAKRNQPGLMRWGLVPPVTVEQVARRTVRGLIAKRRHVYCAAQSYLVSLLTRFAPWLMDLVLKFMYRGTPAPGSRLPAPSA